jgi:hypothetical protein
MAMVTRALSGENAFDEVMALRQLCEGKRSAEEARTVASTYINLLREMETALSGLEQWGSLRAQISLAVSNLPHSLRCFHVLPHSTPFFSYSSAATTSSSQCA